MTSAITNSSSSSSAALTAATGTTPTDPAAAQDRFLKLLVAQLNNQDPMNPMDNAQMTSQMAQINTVTGIQQLNDTVKSLNQQFGSMQLIQGASLVGKDVLSAGNQLTVANGVASGSFDLSAATSAVTVDVLSPGGQVLGTVPLGNLPAGRANFSWNAQSYSGGGTLTYRVNAGTTGAAANATLLTRGTVASVGMDSTGAVSLQLTGGGSVSPSAVASVF